MTRSVKMTRADIRADHSGTESMKIYYQLRNDAPSTMSSPAQDNVALAPGGEIVGDANDATKHYVTANCVNDHETVDASMIF